MSSDEDTKYGHLLPEGGTASMTGEEYESHDEFPDEEIREGEKYMTSPVTGHIYRVTRWVEKGDGKAIALEKELVSRGADAGGEGE